MSLAFTLEAKNSSGHQILYFERDDEGTFSLTLCGTYNGKEIQIDFDELTRDALIDLIRLLSSRLPEGHQP